MGKETGKIRLKDLAWRGFILKGIRCLKEKREDLGLFASVLTAACCFPLPFFCLHFGSGQEGGMGTFIFSVRFIVTVFYV